jgi:hypothetical protein
MSEDFTYTTPKEREVTRTWKNDAYKMYHVELPHMLGNFFAMTKKI